MRTVARSILAVVSTMSVSISSSHAGVKATERVARAFETAGSNGEVAAWVFLTDKGTHELAKGAIPLNIVTDLSIQRRLKVLPADEVVDYADLPLSQEYVAQIASRVRWVRQQSKWFNAVSVQATKAQIEEIELLPFVRSVDLVARFRRSPVEVEQPPLMGAAAPPSPLAKTHSLDYGPSLAQLSLMNVPAVHDQGNYGQNVIIGMFDNGWRLLTHQTFGSMKIIATRDFVDHKTSVVPNNPNPSFGGHGVNTLSTIGGYSPGQLIGPAFGATFILARTENDSSETPIEEDNWAAAIEWADSIGVQVTSTSLGYLTFDAPYTSLTWQDMNGRTALITRAAAMAVRKGIVVVNSAGNEGYDPAHNTLDAPADGDSVIAAGAVDPNGVRSYFSSVGPTTSVPPRIKPDIMAQGSNVIVASSTNTAGFGTSQGTSFSCPLTAGVAALVLHAHPNATPYQVANALRLNASRAAAPDNQYGWGIINALATINFLNTTDTGGDQKPTAYALAQNYPNPFNPVTIIDFEILQESLVTLRVFNTLGEEVGVLANGLKPAGRYAVKFDGSGLPSGVYFYRLRASTTSSQAGSFNATRKMILAK